jgi:hypothetical protein
LIPTASGCVEVCSGFVPEGCFWDFFDMVKKV